jgi:hypothetical protein
MKLDTRTVLLRLAISMAVAIVFAWIVSEGAFRFTLGNDRQTPQQVEIVIPAGTAQRLAAGETALTFPEDMEFVQGDVLLVKNEDVVDHQLGPVWVRPNSSGVLNLDEANLYTMNCSFQPGNRLGLNVRSRATFTTRLLGITTIALPSGLLLWLYTLMLGVKEDQPAQKQAGGMSNGPYQE